MRGDTDGAITLLRRSVEISEIIYKDDPKNIAIAFGNLAQRLARSKDLWTHAEAAYSRSLLLFEQYLPPADPFVATALSNFGAQHLRRNEFAKAADLIGRAAEIDKAAHGATSTQYAIRLHNLGAVYSEWAQETGDAELHRKVREAKEEATRITRALCGMRHPDMTARQNNLAVMHFDSGDIPRAAELMALSVAIELSLDQGEHPSTQKKIVQLRHIWTKSNQSYKAARLAAGNTSDLTPIVEQIEAEHRAWVAEDPDNRKFGPPSPVTGATA